MIYQFPRFLNQQIPVMIALSLLPGLGYIFLGYLNDIVLPALIWYALIVVASLWGVWLYRRFAPMHRKKSDARRWYKELRAFYYFFFFLWTVIFILYAPYHEAHLNYIAIFTQIGAAVVASTLTVSDKKLFIPILTFLMLPLALYFALIGAWYGYVLAIFSLVLFWVLYYASQSTFTLLTKTRFQATHDLLTNLFNRSYAIDHLQEQINELTKSTQCYLFLIDLDHFKTINDTLGHEVGDRLLSDVAKRMETVLEGRHLIARLGGDEFIVLSNPLPAAEVQTIAKAYGHALLHALKQTYHIDQHQLYISASIGISIINDNHLDAHAFIKEADIAMYEAKAQGRDGLFLFNEEMSKRVERHLEIESLLHFSLTNNEITLNYQPQFEWNRKIIGCEVLVRWNNKKYGAISPQEFIPIAEQTGHIVELGNFILEQSFMTLKAWDTMGIKLDQFSINVSMRQFFHHKFIPDVVALMERYLDDTLRSKVIFEITETLAAEDLKKVVTIMHELKKYHIRFSLDDFGTGFSSLSYLSQLPIDELKIDRSFIQSIDDEVRDKTMLNSILNMAKAYDFAIVAEGVETQEQMEFFKQTKHTIYQGYLFSKPLTKESFQKLYLNFPVEK